MFLLFVRVTFSHPAFTAVHGFKSRRGRQQNQVLAGTPVPDAVRSCLRVTKPSTFLCTICFSSDIASSQMSIVALMELWRSSPWTTFGSPLFCRSRHSAETDSRCSRRHPPRLARRRRPHNSHSPSQPQQQMAFFGFLYRFWIEALHNHTVDMGD